MNVLVLAPHPDDEAIGCGGALCRHADKGDRIVVVFLTSGELGLKHLAREMAWSIREKEARNAAKILGAAELHFLRGPDWMTGGHKRKLAAALRPILQREMPQLVYLPHPCEWHPDHKAALPIVRAALKQVKIPKPLLRTYEVWTPLTEYDHVENISAVMSRKLRAVRAHRSQIGEFDYVRAARGLNQFRGATAAKCAYAEVFGDGAGG
jgi:LmbE family N-acetylglucosaminyl deacetylase